MPLFQGPAAVEFLDGDFTVDTLPPAAANAKKYAWVTDLHDGQPDRVISAGGFWKPVRPLAVRNVANSNVAGMVLFPLKNSPTQIMLGSLTALRTIALSPLGAYPGARFRVRRSASGLFNLNVLDGITSGLIGGLGVSSWADFEFDGTAWVQTASGGIL